MRERYVRHEKVLMGVVCCGGWCGIDGEAVKINLGEQNKDGFGH